MTAALVLLLPGLARAQAPAPPREALDRPNVVVILLDDAGYGDFEHNGNPVVRTPSITKMAQQGACFTQFYDASPACSASRYGLLTGRVPGRSGLGAYVIGPESARYLHPREITLADGLKQQGYATAMFGKWHLGTPNAKNGFAPESLPLAHGFNQWIGTNVSHDYQDALLLQSDPAGREPVAGYRVLAKNLPSDHAATDSLTRRYTEAATAFIHANRAKPFFAYVALNQPHLALFCGPEFKGRSRRGLLGDVMEEADDCAGKILAALEAEGIAGNTLVILSSDNGPWLRFMNTAKHPMYGEAQLNVGYAQPFRNGKGSDWEGGSRVPGLFYWPGVVAPARIQEPASLLDVLPTVFGIAGAKVPADRSVDGRDLRSLLSDQLGGKAVKDFIFTYPDPANHPVALRRGPWKLMTGVFEQYKDADGGFTASPAKPLLFQVEQDLGERIDRAAEHPDLVAKMKQELEARTQQIKDEGSFWDQEAKAPGAGAPVAAVPGPIKDQNYRLVFQDEFGGAAGAKPDPKKWQVRMPGKWRDGWNMEDAARLDGQGHLVITTRRVGDRVETGYIGTQGKFSATHGYFECRCAMQKEEGFWSAFWIQTPTMGKPVGDAAKAGVEIDVMEYLADQKHKDKAMHTAHWDGYDKANHKTEHVAKKVPGLSEGFHTFAVKWDEAGYVFFTDGVETGRWKRAPISNRPEYLILSCEIGPWAGDIGKAKLPDAFTVDYVRVWQTPAQIKADRARAAEADQARAAAAKKGKP